METWRIVATTLLAITGVIGVLIIVAKAREKTRSARAAAVTWLVSFTALAVLCVLTLTVLPGVFTWVLVGAVTLIVSVLAIAS